MPVITAIYGHCDVLQGTEGAPQRPQISRSVDKKSLHDMIGKLFPTALLLYLVEPAKRKEREAPTQMASWDVLTNSHTRRKPVPDNTGSSE